jgi:hypothetical protein
MFAFLKRRKAAGVGAGMEAAARSGSADARRKRLFDRTVMSPDVIMPASHPRATREIFGLKLPASDPVEDCIKAET